MLTLKGSELHKTKIESTKKILAVTNLPKITQFQGKIRGASEYLDLVDNLRYADPDKKIERRAEGSRWIGPKGEARLCLIICLSLRRVFGDLKIC